jgi:hypothetical protein
MGIYAVNAPGYEGFASKPLAGQISGVALDGLGRKTPKTFLGLGGAMSAENAVVMHAELAAVNYAEVTIANMFAACLSG